jgi:hypothetical protein
MHVLAGSHAVGSVTALMRMAMPFDRRPRQAFLENSFLWGKDLVGYEFPEWALGRHVGEQFGLPRVRLTLETSKEKACQGLSCCTLPLT